MKQCSCGRTTEGSTICIVVCEKKTPGDERNTSVPVGAVETVCCKTCLANMVRKALFFDFLKFLIELVVISLVSGLIAKVFSLVWIGGSILFLLCVFQLIRSMAGDYEKTRVNGAAYKAFSEYKKAGSIPEKDFIYLTDEGNAMIRNGGFPLEKTADFDPNEDVAMATYWATEQMLKTAPADDTEANMGRSFLVECIAKASPDHLVEPPKIRKQFLKPLAIFFLLAATAPISLIALFDGIDGILYRSDARHIFFLIAGIAMVVLGIGGSILLMIRRKVIWVLPVLAMTVLFWIRVALDTMHFERELGLLIPISLLIIAALLSWLPYCIRKDN